MTVSSSEDAAVYLQHEVEFQGPVEAVVARQEGQTWELLDVLFSEISIEVSCMFFCFARMSLHYCCPRWHGSAINRRSLP